MNSLLFASPLGAIRKFVGLLASITAWSVPAFASDLILVDHAGTGDFQTIQGAINFAQSGDQIVVLAGDYPGFSISVNATHIVAANGADVVITEPVQIRNIPNGRQVTLTGLTIDGGYGPSYSSNAGIAVKNCAGSVRIFDCDIEGFRPAGADSAPGVFIQNCDDVTLSECKVEAQYGSTSVPGLLGDGSTIALFDCNLRGGESGNTGGSGALLSGLPGLLYATDTVFRGGPGDDGYCGGSWGAEAGDGGDGLVNINWDVRLQDSALLGGPGGYGDTDYWSCTIYDGDYGSPSVGPITFIQGIAPQLELDPLVEVGQAFMTLTVRGTPGDLAYIYASLGSDFRLDNRQVGPRLLAEPYLGIMQPMGGGTSQLGGGIPLGLQSNALGVIGPQGFQQVQVPVLGEIPPGKSRAVHFQAVAVTPGGSVHMSDPHTVAFLPCDLGFDCNSNGVDDGCDISQGTSLDCNEDGVPDECEWDCNSNGIPDDCDVTAGRSLDVNSNGTPDECEGVVRLHVNASAAPGGDGLTWGSAFNDLQDAFDYHQLRPLETEEIWVAAGTYTPTSGTDRGVSFTPGSETRVRGGFAGVETLLSQRNLDAFESVLSGDLAGNDDFPMGIEENSHNVLAISYAHNVMVDGFTIRGGNADHPSPYGGGVAITSSLNFLLSRCKIEENTARAGGAGLMVAGDTSGGVSSGDFINCSIMDNRAEPLGINSPTYGGGAYFANGHERIRLVGCEIVRNYSYWGGAAAWHWYSNSPVEYLNCTIAFNDSELSRSGVYSAGAPITAQGTIAWGNTTGSGLPEDQGAFTGPIVNFDVRLSCVQGTPLFPGPGNINDYPVFVNSGLGDYRLVYSSPCIDAGRNGAIPNSDPSDLDQDGIIAEELPLDFGGATRRLDDPATVDTGSGVAPVVDMGAHEFDPGAP